MTLALTRPTLDQDRHPESPINRGGAEWDDNWRDRIWLIRDTSLTPDTARVSWTGEKPYGEGLSTWSETMPVQDAIDFIEQEVLHTSVYLDFITIFHNIQ